MVKFALQTMVPTCVSKTAQIWAPNIWNEKIKTQNTVFYFIFGALSAATGVWIMSQDEFEERTQHWNKYHLELALSGIFPLTYFTYCDPA